jgi:hypothetical protein
VAKALAFSETTKPPAKTLVTIPYQALKDSRANLAQELERVGSESEQPDQFHMLCTLHTWEHNPSALPLLITRGQPCYHSVPAGIWRFWVGDLDCQWDWDLLDQQAPEVAQANQQVW